MSRPETDKLDQLTWDELDEDLQDLTIGENIRRGHAARGVSGRRQGSSLAALESE